MIYIEMEKPEKCSECRFKTEYEFCKAMPDNFCGNTDDNKRPEWCPLKESTSRGKWIYCEDEYGQDGYKCSECGFFVPWFHDFGTIDFINDYKLCPSCGKTMECSAAGEAEMIDKEKVVKGLEHCRQYGTLGGRDCSGIFTYTNNGRDIVKTNEHRHDCPYGKCKTGCVVTLVDDAIALLKEKEY